MKNLVTTGLVLTSVFALGACGLNSKAAKVEITKEMIDIVQAERAESIPAWYVDLPEDQEDKIFGAGTGLSSDLQFSMDKAMHQAKVTLGDKINNSVSGEFKTYMADNSAIGTGMAVEETQKVSKSGFKNVDVSEYSVIDKAVTMEGISFRTYVLMSVDPGGRKNTQPTVSVDDVQAAQEKARTALDNL
tara:strand:- start:1262 stop:1828 length:567 start_codon:yes stop_codon:yes gene_type:complete